MCIAYLPGANSAIGISPPAVYWIRKTAQLPFESQSALFTWIGLVHGSGYGCEVLGGEAVQCLGQNRKDIPAWPQRYFPDCTTTLALLACQYNGANSPGLEGGTPKESDRHPEYAVHHQSCSRSLSNSCHRTLPAASQRKRAKGKRSPSAWATSWTLITPRGGPRAAEGAASD
jgi:hypothetical protein